MSNAQMSANRRSTALIRLLGICAAAALLAVGWTAAGASAQAAPTVTVDHAGWAADLDPSDPNTPHYEEALASQTLQIAGGGTWDCGDLRCHLMHVFYRNIPERPHNSDKPGHYTVTLTRVAPPSAEEVGVSEHGFEAATQMSIPSDTFNHAHVGVPWLGEEVRVTVTGDQNISASVVVEIPAHIPASFRSREARGGSTLVTDSASSLPKVVSVWPELAEATHYEVQYTFRTRSRAHSRFTKVTRIVTVSQSANEYEALGANWDQHPNASELNALDNDDVGSDGDWIVVVTTLPKLLAGAEGWAQETVGGEQLADDEAIADALDAGKNAVGIRVRPLIICAAGESIYKLSNRCSENSHHADPRALEGKISRISYVTFAGGSMAEWVSSAGTAR